MIISSDVLFVTHDASYTILGDRTRSLFGEIKIGNNCFIGERSTIMYGVELADSIIVAAGTVVTKSFKQQGVIIGGNPAKVISTLNRFAEHSKNKGMLLSETFEAVKKSRWTFDKAKKF